MNGYFLSRAVSIAKIILSPAAIPKEPPIKEKSCTAITTFVELIAPDPIKTESFFPVFDLASLIRSIYFF